MSFGKITTLVFDWGNTMMKVFPEYQGPMINWEQVAAIDGAETVLKELYNQYHIVLATNADDSSSTEVWNALKRVAIDQYFSEIYVSHEMGHRKPETMFYQTLLTRLGIDVSQVIYIGDDYNNDILAACAAGWQAVWFNPNTKSPPGLIPLQSGEINRLDMLPGVLSSYHLPPWNTCIYWLLEAGASSNLLAHMQSVAAISYQMAQWLRCSGIEIDVLLAHRGGLLHDIAKLKTSTGSPDHGILGAEILSCRCQSELAEIALRHPLFCLQLEDRQPLTWEQKVVHLADKFVEGAAITSLESRMMALLKRYPDHKEKIQACIPGLMKLHEEICQIIGITSDELIIKLQAALSGR